MITPIGRRDFLVGLGAAGLAASLAPGCHDQDPRALALRAMIERVVLPDARQVVVASAQLHDAATALAAAPNDASLAAARSAWKQAALSWAKAFAFRQGPFVSTSALLRASCWPVRLGAVSELVRSDRTINAALVEELGADVKGLFAIEPLLFAAPADAPDASWLAGPQRARARTLIAALADGVHGYARRADEALGDGRALEEQLAHDARQSLSVVVNQMIETTETVVAGRVELALNAGKSGNPAATDVQGRSSGLSTQIPSKFIATSARLYDQLVPMVRKVSPEVQARVQSAFASARAALAALGRPLDEVARATPERLKIAALALRALELSLKTDLATALGVTLTFVSGDGD